MGPIGSGKSSAACIFIYQVGYEQAPDADGVRRTRWAVVRNTQAQLRLTTIKTWLGLFPDGVMGDMHWSPPLSFTLRHNPGDGTQVEIEVLFMALDDPAAVQNLYSLELTGAWVNEAQFVEKTVVDTLVDRVGRYPAAKEGAGSGATWCGVVMDTNAPPEEHWWPIMAGERSPPEWMSDEDKVSLVKPEGWTFFVQPAAVHEVYNERGTLIGYRTNPAAENLRFLKAGYYERAVKGKTRAHIERNLMNRFGRSFDGKPVFPDFRRERHVAPSPILFAPDAPVYIGIDFGRTPAAVFLQRRMSRWFALREIVTEDMGAKKFGRLLRYRMREWFPDIDHFLIWGDPAGNQQSQTDDVTPFMMLRSEGVIARPAPSNDLDIRKAAVEGPLTREEEGQPCLMISPACPVLAEALEGGYRYRRVRGSGSAYYEEVPEKKGRWSHVVDALQYALLGGGEGREAVKPPKPSAPSSAGRPGGYSVWARQRGLAVRQPFGGRR